jgi:hypothetical protein
MHRSCGARVRRDLGSVAAMGIGPRQRSAQDAAAENILPLPARRGNRTHSKPGRAARAARPCTNELVEAAPFLLILILLLPAILFRFMILINILL